MPIIEDIMNHIANDAIFTNQLGVDFNNSEERMNFLEAVKGVELVAHGRRPKTNAELAQDGITEADRQEFLWAQDQAAQDSTNYAMGPMGQFEYIDPRFYEHEERKLNYRDLFPIVQKADPADETASYMLERLVGKTDKTGAVSNTGRRVDVIETKHTVNVKGDDVYFEVTTDDLRKAAKTGRPIEARKIRSANRAAEQTIHDGVIFGDDEAKLIGFLNHPDIVETEVAAGASTSKLWSGKTAQEILNIDIGGQISLIRAQTFNNHSPTHFGISIERYNYLAFNWIEDVAAPRPISMLQWLQDNVQAFGLSNIVPMPELAGAGPASSEMGIFWENDEDVLEVDIPLPLTFLMPEIRGKKIIFTGEFRHSDMKLRRKQACRRIYGF
jgi:hypothetical protein